MLLSLILHLSNWFWSQFYWGAGSSIAHPNIDFALFHISFQKARTWFTAADTTNSTRTTFETIQFNTFFTAFFVFFLFFFLSNFNMGGYKHCLLNETFHLTLTFIRLILYFGFWHLQLEFAQSVDVSLAINSLPCWYLVYYILILEYSSFLLHSLHNNCPWPESYWGSHCYIQ